MYKKPKALIVMLAVLTIALYITGCGSGNKTEGPPPDTSVIVEAAYAKKSSIERIATFSGTVVPEAEVSIVPKMGGKVEIINFKIGDTIKKGDVIIQLEQIDASNQLKQAEAALAMARANHNMLKSGQLPGQQAQTEANYLNAEANFKRMQQLYDEGAISEQQYDGAKLQYTVAKAQYETTMATAPESLQAAEAQVKQAEAAYALAKSAYDNTRLISPIDGIVSMVDPEPGEMAAPGMPAATVVNIDTVIIDVNVSGSKINSLKRGQELDVLIASASDTPFKGVVTQLSPAADPRTKMFPMKIEVENKQRIIKGGMFATVKAAIDKKDDALIIPKDALIERNEGYIVFIDEGGKAKSQIVTVGVRGDEAVEVLTGLKPDDRVIVVGHDALEDGDTIEVRDWGEGL